MDTGAIERLSERMARTRAQQASVAKKLAERDDDTITPNPPSHQPDRQPDREHDRDHARTNATPAPDTQPATDTGPVAVTNINDATPGKTPINVIDTGDTRLAYTAQPYDLQNHTGGEPTYTLFGGWQTNQQLGFVAVTQNDQGITNTHISTEDRGDRDIETDLTNRIDKVIERSQTQQTDTPQPGHEHQEDRPAELEPHQHQSPTNHQAQTQQSSPARSGEIREPTNDTTHDREREREPQEIAPTHQDQPPAWEQNIEHDHGFGIG